MALRLVSPVDEGVQHLSAVDAAWHVFQALALRQQAHPELLDSEYYQEAVREAHAGWAVLFQ
ncbi:MAG: hypothetical protein V4657_11420 [Pseudomonadota bacterium]